MDEDFVSTAALLLVVLFVTAVIMAGLAVEVARYRGASRSRTLAYAAAGASVGLVMFAFAGIVGLVAIVVASVFMAVWLNLFLLVRRLNHRRG